MPYRYKGSELLVPATADITPEFRPGARFHGVVQAALRRLPVWSPEERPHQTFDLPCLIGEIVVRLTDGDTPKWGINPTHRARRPGESPFVVLAPDDGRAETSVATLHVAGTVERPILTRTYPGYDIPPLPWMTSAQYEPGGPDACAMFWSEHAYVAKTSQMPDMLSDQPPAWHHEAAEL